MNTVIILAAGRGTRMKADMNKQYLLLEGKPIIAHTIEAFDNSPLIDNIVLVINELDNEIFKKEIINKYDFKKVRGIVNGGKERQESVMNGLSTIDEGSNVVLVHDGARPFVSDKIISNCIDGAIEYSAVSAGVAVKDTIKVIDSDRSVLDTPDRTNLWITQTPQAFKADILRKAHDKALDDEFLGTDDASLVERLGVVVKMVDGDYTNFKITTPDDLIYAEAIVNHKSNKSQ